MKCFPSKTWNITGAIRPLDVAAIVCVLGVLAFLGMIGMSHFKARVLRVQCQGNLMKIGESLNLYAGDNHGQLPDFSGGNPRYSPRNWPWDMDTNFVSELEAKGLNREVFYRPANPAMNDDRHWNFWRVVGGQIRVAGYGFLFKGTGMVPPNLWVSKLENKNPAAPAQTELGFDATACLGDDYTRIQGLWIDRSNHMKDRQPLGGNVLCLDQHVEWRDFSRMQVRFHTFGPGGVIDWSY
jgi:hypothetical protein